MKIHDYHFRAGCMLHYISSYTLLLLLSSFLPVAFSSTLYLTFSSTILFSTLPYTLSLQQWVQYLPGEGDSHAVWWHQQALGAGRIWQSFLQSCADLSQPWGQQLQSGGPQAAGWPAGTKQCAQTNTHTNSSKIDNHLHVFWLYTYSAVTGWRSHTNFCKYYRTEKSQLVPTLWKCPMLYCWGLVLHLSFSLPHLTCAL